MANNVFANGRELACKSGAGKTICAFPDTCFTPPENPATPPGVPVPYPNTGFASDTTKGSKTVKITNKEIMLKDQSYFKTSVGDEAGCAAKKGVITSANKGKVYFQAWSMDVKVEGENVDRHLDMTTNNHASQSGDTPPWVFTDEMASSTIIDKKCKDKKEEYTKECEPPKYKKKSVIKKGKKVEIDVRDCSDSCSEKQKCQLVEKKNDKKECCDPSTTGHHVIPKAEFLIEGSTRPLNTSLENYNPQKAPCVCAEGTSWHTRDNINELRPLKEHGRLHRAYKKQRARRGLKVGENVSYSELRNAGAEAVCETFDHCDKECIAKQLDEYHVNQAEIPKNEKVCRVSNQKQSVEFKPKNPGN